MRRVDAFSDAVFGIAITLLVLELPFERVPPGELLDTLGHRWPSFVTYAVSFLTIGICTTTPSGTRSPTRTGTCSSST
jgi:uncharacterized membrane protein